MTCSVGVKKCKPSSTLIGVTSSTLILKELSQMTTFILRVNLRPYVKLSYDLYLRVKLRPLFKKELSYDFYFKELSYDLYLRKS